MAQTILVVDDKKELRVMVQSYLEEEGFRVVLASDGQEALYVARHERPDLIILDLMMPNMGGYDFLKAHKREADTPVIILTARLEEGDKILGLELGDNYFVTKPFSMRELTVVARAVLRRAGACTDGTGGAARRRCDAVRGSRKVSVESRPVDLTPSEFDLLAVFLSSPGTGLDARHLLDRLQGDAFDGYERTIDVHIRNLRTKLEQTPASPTTWRPSMASAIVCGRVIGDQ